MKNAPPILSALAFGASVAITAGSATAAITSTGLIQDLDADIGVVEAGGAGTGVTSWINQGSAGDDVATNSGTPTIVAGPNGGNAIALAQGIRLAGDDGAAFDAIINGTGNTWFAVVQDGGNSGTKNAVFGTLLNTGPWSGTVGHVGDGLGRYLLRPGGSDNFVAGTTNISSGWHIIAGRLDAGTGALAASMFTDGPVAENTITPSITGTTDSGPLAIGAERTGGGEHFDGDLARLLIYDRPLTDTELNETGYALAQAYGLTTTFTPEPSSIMLLGLGALGFALRRRR